MKSILINGFPRSGTTYLFRYLKWVSNGRALFEPVTSIRSFFHSKQKIPKNLLLYHPKICEYEPIYFRFFYDLDMLQSFLEKLKDFFIKETTLHFYLNQDFIKRNWHVYLIIRHPGDVYLSFINAFMRKRYPWLRMLEKIKIKKDSLPMRCLRHNIIFAELYALGKKFYELFINSKYEPTTLLECFVIVWTIANHYALKSINPEKQLIIYEKKETYYKLPKFKKWEKIEPLKIKKYRAGKKYEDLFLKIAKKFNIEDKYKYIMAIFKE